jgi:hypothetical protein
MLQFVFPLWATSKSWYLEVRLQQDSSIKSNLSKKVSVKNKRKMMDLSSKAGIGTLKHNGNKSKQHQMRYPG